MPTIPQRDVYRLINDAGDRGERVVVATVAHTRGSTPQQRGAKMLFFQNGEIAGTVGGGCIEAEVWAEAQTAMRSGKSQLHHFSLTADEASEEGMVCGGTMDIFIEVMNPELIADFQFHTIGNRKLAIGNNLCLKTFSPTTKPNTSTR